MKPIIGIIARPIIDDENSHNIGTMEAYRKALVASNAIPLCILPTQNITYDEFAPRVTPRMTEEEIDSLIKQIVLCDGIIMPGGCKWYEYDEIVCKYCLKNNIPILGICMGEQIMGNVDINNCHPEGDKTIKNNTEINHFQRSTNYVHEINIKTGTKLYEILGNERIKVNSRHNYHINKIDNFIVSATADDGIIEAIEFPEHKFAIGLQWHPESLIEFDDNSKKIFDYFINISKSK